MPFYPELTASDSDAIVLMIILGFLDSPDCAVLINNVID